MRAIDALARALIAAGICCGTLSGGTLAQTLGLPDVTVTAPPITPSWKKWNPYSSNPRVEEEKWPDIPCGDSRISAGGATNSNMTSISPSNCRMAHDLVFTDTSNLMIEADAVVVDPYFVSATGSQHKGCYVQAHYSDLREDFPDMNQMTRRGSAWRNFIESGDLSTMEFSLGASDCRALEKRGPTWLGGHTYVIHASVCRKDGRDVDASNVEFALGSLQVRLYEPRGNLRAPPQ